MVNTNSVSWQQRQRIDSLLHMHGTAEMADSASLLTDSRQDQKRRIKPPMMFGIVGIPNPIREIAHLHHGKSTWAKSSRSYKGLIYFNLNLSLGSLCMASKYLILLNINWVFNSRSVQIYHFGCYLHAAVDIN